MFALIYNDGTLSNQDIKENFKAEKHISVAQLQIGDDTITPLFWDVQTADRFIRRNGLFVVISGMVRLGQDDINKLSKETPCRILEYPAKVNKIAKKVDGYTYELVKQDQPVDSLLV